MGFATWLQERSKVVQVIRPEHLDEEGYFFLSWETMKVRFAFGRINATLLF